MAFCTECGHQLAYGAKFCYECGAKVDVSFSPQIEVRKTVYDGELYRCPNCGDILDAYESVCEACGYERRGVKVTRSVQELSNKLEEIEALRLNPKTKRIFKQTINQNQLSKTDNQKINLIQNFPIPNSREDIIEFAVLAISNVDPDVFNVLHNNDSNNKSSQQALSNAWLSKFEQAYQKGCIMFGESPELERIHSLYVAKKKSIRRSRTMELAIYGAFFGIVLVFWTLILFGVI